MGHELENVWRGEADEAGLATNLPRRPDFLGELYLKLAYLDKWDDWDV